MLPFVVFSTRQNDPTILSYRNAHTLYIQSWNVMHILKNLCGHSSLKILPVVMFNMAWMWKVFAVEHLHIHQFDWAWNLYTGCFIMFSVITNIYNKKTKEPTLMELFTATGKLKKFFLTTRDARCVHRGWHGTDLYDIQVLATHVSTCVPCQPWCTHRTSLVVNKKKKFSCGCEQFH